MTLVAPLALAMTVYDPAVPLAVTLCETAPLEIVAVLGNWVDTCAAERSHEGDDAAVQRLAIGAAHADHQRLRECRVDQRGLMVAPDFGSVNPRDSNAPMSQGVPRGTPR